jgi:hypothetical protein
MGGLLAVGGEIKMQENVGIKCPHCSKDIQLVVDQPETSPMIIQPQRIVVTVPAPIPLRIIEVKKPGE